MQDGDWLRPTEKRRYRTQTAGARVRVEYSKSDGRMTIGFGRRSIDSAKKKRQEECEPPKKRQGECEGGQKMDHRSGPRVAK